MILRERELLDVRKCTRAELKAEPGWVAQGAIARAYCKTAEQGLVRLFGPTGWASEGDYALYKPRRFFEVEELVPDNRRFANHAKIQGGSYP